MALDNVHNLTPGDLYIHIPTTGNRQVWLLELQGVWQCLKGRVGIEPLSDAEGASVRHPVTANLWLDYPVHGKPSWIKLQTLQRRSNTSEKACVLLQP